MNLRTIDQITEGHLDDLTHLIPASSENCGCVVRDDADIPDTRKIKIGILSRYETLKND